MATYADGAVGNARSMPTVAVGIGQAVGIEVGQATRQRRPFDGVRPTPTGQTEAVGIAMPTARPSA